MPDAAAHMAEQGTLLGELLAKLGLVTPGQLEEALALQKKTGQRVGELLVSLGYVTHEQLQCALAEMLGVPSRPRVAKPPLGEVLIGLGHITDAQLEQALARQRTSGRKLGEILVEQGACTYRQIYEALTLQQRMGGGEVQPKERERRPSSLRVMVVDDSPLACQLVEQGLTEQGYEVVCFQDPFEALEQVPKLEPSIVLTDLEMPGIDGAELCRRLKAGSARSTPVIILTVNDSDGQRIHGLKAGADDYVHKGASMGELAARIEAVVRRTGETERMRRLFARYTSDAVVDEILSRGDVVLTGEKRQVTVLFADIRDFTGLADSLPPEYVVRLLNGALGRMADAVLTCGGTLDKFLGDGLMAIFGAPVAHGDDALRALQAARMMMESVRELNDDNKRTWASERPDAPAPELELGIGINSGLAVVGNVGSARRTEYTCIGDAVNVAARFCALARPGEILVGEQTSALVGHTERLEPLPPVRLKGKKGALPVFRAHWYRARAG